MEFGVEQFESVSLFFRSSTSTRNLLRRRRGMMKICQTARTAPTQDLRILGVTLRMMRRKRRNQMKKKMMMMI